MLTLNIAYSDKFVQNLDPVNPNDVTTKKYVDSRLNLNSNSNTDVGLNLIDKILGKYETKSVIRFDINRYESENIVKNGALPVKNDDSKYPISQGGWMYINDVENYPLIQNPSSNVHNKINWYILNNSSKELIYSFGNMKSIFLRLMSYSSILPFINLYTYKNEDGTDYSDSSSYRSSVSYDIQSEIIQGKDTVLYIGQDPRDCGFNNLQNVESFVNYTPSSYKGPIGQTSPTSDEIISFIELSTLPGDAGNIKFTLLEFGIRFDCYLQRTATYMS
jgi:hypothetical protein